jgi:uncharacterized cofD-like protein
MRVNPKIVAIGGGTGLPIVLHGLKNSCDLTAVVTVTDTGKSSGRLREEYDMLPPGDIRNCLIALSQSEKLMLDLFQYRFESGTFKGHSFGNIFLASLTKVTGSFRAALKQAHKILAIDGSVLPSTLDSSQLCAKCADGRVIKGETAIAYRKNTQSPIERVFLEPADPEAPEEVVARIYEADAVVIGPGGLYTSVITNLLVKGVRDAIVNSSALKIYVANIVTDKAQTMSFSAPDHLNTVEKYLGSGTIDYMLVNSQKPAGDLEEAYRQEGAQMVFHAGGRDTPGSSQGAPGVVTGDMLEDIPESPSQKRFWWEKRQLLRHDPAKLGSSILAILAENTDGEHEE